jgi:hypothetical protein
MGCTMQKTWCYQLQLHMYYTVALRILGSTNQSTYLHKTFVNILHPFCIFNFCFSMSWGSVVGTVARLWAGVSTTQILVKATNISHRQNVPASSKAHPGSTARSARVPSQVECGWGTKLTTHLHHELRLRIGAATPLLPLHAFMACMGAMSFLSFFSSQNELTLILLTQRIGWAPNNASTWQMGFNLAFKGLIK